MADAWMDASSFKPLAIGLVAVLFVYKLLSTRRRTDGIPMVPYALPWIGSALAIGKDPDAFLREAEQVIASYAPPSSSSYLFILRERCGPMFRVKLLGSEDIFVTSAPVCSSCF
jgi:hypothetical protein